MLYLEVLVLLVLTLCRRMLFVALDELVVGFLGYRVGGFVSRVQPPDVLALFAHGLGRGLDDLVLGEDCGPGKLVEIVHCIVGLPHHEEVAATDFADICQILLLDKLLLDVTAFARGDAATLCQI